MQKDEFKIGDKVTYQVPGISQRGIVKGLSGNFAYIFVVFDCGQDWDNYQNYTGVMTPKAALRHGWPTQQTN